MLPSKAADRVHQQRRDELDGGHDQLAGNLDLTPSGAPRELPELLLGGLPPRRWIGLTTVVGGVFVWRGSVTAIFVSALAGGCADLGDFLFIDLGGYNLFVPGTVMTLICATAIASSFWAYFQSSDAGETKGASA